MELVLPEIKPVVSLEFQEPESFVLDNGIELYGFNGSTNDILKLSVIFDSGRWTESNPLSASVCSELFKSGVSEKSAFEIEESIDYLGSTIKASAGYNSFTVSLYCLTRNLEPCLQILVQLLNDTIFPEDELELAKTNRLSRLKVNQMKNDYVGDMLFKEVMFGNQHPYGYVTTKKMINDVNRDDVLNFYSNNLNYKICLLGLAGKFGSTEIDLINKYLGNQDYWKHSGHINTQSWDTHPSSEKIHIKELPDSVQASIYIGKDCIQRDHEDYFGFSFLTMIYGGYFGSRLMNNIREEKGLTYGIYSYIQNYRNASVFCINTETATENIGQCLHEIYFEMERLKNQPIEQEELLKARNYMLGRMLDQVDGPFKSAGTFIGLKSHGLEVTFLRKMEYYLKNVEPSHLQDLAQKYFVKDDLYEVVVR